MSPIAARLRGPSGERLLAASFVAVLVLTVLVPLTARTAVAAIEPGEDYDDFALEVSKTHDEPAGGYDPGATVEFTVTVTNPNAFDVTIDGVTDSVEGGAEVAVCAGLVDTVLGAGATTDCSFDGTASVELGGSVTDEVTVYAHRVIPGQDGPSARRFVYSENTLDNGGTYLVFDGDDYTTGTFDPCDFNDDSGCDPSASSWERGPQPFFLENPGLEIGVLTGGQSKEAIHEIVEPRSDATDTDWSTLGPTANGYANFFGTIDPSTHADQHNVGVGLGANEDVEHLGDVPTNVYGIPGFYEVADGREFVIPLHELVGETVCMLVKDDDVSLNNADPFDYFWGNYMGDYMGHVAITILEFDPSWSEDPYDPGAWNTDLGETSSSFFPAMRVRIEEYSVCAATPDVTEYGSGSAQATANTVPPITVSIVKNNDANEDDTFTDTETANSPNQDVTFEAVITNTSEVTVVIDSLTDEWDGQSAFELACDEDATPIGVVLAPDESFTCTWTESGYGPFFDGSAIVNTATVEVSQQGHPANTATDDDPSTVNPPATPNITVEIVKDNDANEDDTFTDSEQANTPNQDVTFQAVITNTSDVTVVIDSLTDEWDGQSAFELACDEDATPIGVVLAPDESFTCTWTETGYGPFYDESPIVNTATVVVSQQDFPANTANDDDPSTVTAPPEPEITVTIVKDNDANEDDTFTDAEQANAPDQDVTFQAVITNTSDVPVQITSLTDEWDGQSAFELACDEDATPIGVVLDPDESFTCTWTETGYGPGYDGSAIVNTATVVVGEVGNLSNTDTADDPSTVTAPPAPAIGIEIVKDNDANEDGTFTDAEQANAESQAVTFQAVITNNEGIAVTITSLTDEVNGVPDSEFDILCETIDGVTQQEPTSPVGMTLEPGESLTCTWTVDDYSPDFEDGGKVNTATVEVIDELERTDSDDDTSTVTSPPPPPIGIEIVKTNDANEDGESTDAEQAPTETNPVTFRAVITNSGGEPVAITSLTDEINGVPDSDFDILCETIDGVAQQEPTSPVGMTLAAGESLTCTWTVDDYSPEFGGDPKVNTATVDVIDERERTDSDDDTSTVTSPPVELGVEVIKLNDADEDGDFTDDEQAQAEGDAVDFSVLVRNLSNVSVTITSLTDVWEGTDAIDVCADLIGTTLAPAGDEGDTATCTFTVLDYAPEAGTDLVNTVTVEVTDEREESVSDDDDSNVFTADLEVLPQQLEQLPTTGADHVLLMLLFAMAIIGAGGALVGRTGRLDAGGVSDME